MRIVFEERVDDDSYDGSVGVADLIGRVAPDDQSVQWLQRK